MSVQCPHCQHTLMLSAAQLEKIKTALASLAADKTLKIGCPKCSKPIELNADGSVVVARKMPPPVGPPPAAPRPPDLDWLSSGTYTEKEAVENVPHALIMIKDEHFVKQVTMAFAERGYQATCVNSAAEAISKMQFMNFEAVALHSGFEGGGLEDSEVHQYLRAMAMVRRRYIFYILIGPEFHTLYDLEALANSANLVVNDRDLNHLPLILKKGMHDYQALFGSYLEALGNYGVK